MKVQMHQDKQILKMLNTFILLHGLKEHGQVQVLIQ